jgi:hypothetical protein
LREEGRIAFQDLALKGRRQLAVARTSEECDKIFCELQLEANNIEKAQSNRFFGTSPSEPVTIADLGATITTKVQARADVVPIAGPDQSSVATPKGGGG